MELCYRKLLFAYFITADYFEKLSQVTTDLKMLGIKEIKSPILWRKLTFLPYLVQYKTWWVGKSLVSHIVCKTCFETLKKELLQISFQLCLVSKISLESLIDHVLWDYRWTSYVWKSFLLLKKKYVMLLSRLHLISWKTRRYQSTKILYRICLPGKQHGWKCVIPVVSLGLILWNT